MLSSQNNGSNSFLIVNATKIHQLKAKDCKIKPYILFLGNISRDFTIDNMKKKKKKKPGLKAVVKVLFVDYNAIDTSSILDIHRYLMKET